MSLLALLSAHARRTARAPHSTTAVPVLLIPGLMAGDWTMSLLAHQLEQRGHATIRARIGINIGCTSQLVDRLEDRLAAAAERYGSRIAVVGWSRGGTLGKLVTLRRPELVAALVTLASPNVNPLAVSRKVERQIRMLSWLNAVGAHGVLGTDCLSGECAEAIGRELQKPFPVDVPYTAFYSKRDGVVDWRACCDPAAELIEVNDSHLGVGADPEVIRMVAERLARVVARAA
jgi:triacylglycerol lipase